MLSSGKTLVYLFQLVPSYRIDELERVKQEISGMVLDIPVLLCSERIEEVLRCQHRKEIMERKRMRD